MTNKRFYFSKMTSER